MCRREKVHFYSYSKHTIKWPFLSFSLCFCAWLCVFMCICMCVWVWLIPQEMVWHLIWRGVAGEVLTQQHKRKSASLTEWRGWWNTPLTLMTEAEKSGGKYTRANTIYFWDMSFFLQRIRMCIRKTEPAIVDLFTTTSRTATTVYRGWDHSILNWFAVAVSCLPSNNPVSPMPTAGRLSG